LGKVESFNKWRNVGGRDETILYDVEDMWRVDM
jgi:hypothetical protein